MKNLMVAAALLILPTTAIAESCCSNFTSTLSYCCTGNGTCSTCCSNSCGEPSGPSFSTIHKWVQRAPGQLELSGTNFTIKFGEADQQYELWRGDKKLDAGLDLDSVERGGIKRASNLQDVGLPLK